MELNLSMIWTLKSKLFLNEENAYWTKRTKEEGKERRQER